MSLPIEEIKKLIVEAMPDATVEIKDLYTSLCCSILFKPLKDFDLIVAE